jgi:heme exporter protein D
MPEQFFEYIFLALGGYAFHLSKQYLESVKRNEQFVTKLLKASVLSNLIAIPLLVYVGDKLPDDFLVMGPVAAIIIGALSSSLLSGLISIKKPKDLPE